MWDKPKSWLGTDDLDIIFKVKGWYALKFSTKKQVFYKSVGGVSSDFAGYDIGKIQ